MTSEIHILSTAVQLAQADEICSPLGWGITLKDWESYAKHFTVYGITDLESGKVIATSVLYPQGNNLMTIGGVIVHPSFRKRGLANKLVRSMISKAENDKVTRLGLLGSGMGSPIYASLGFQTVGLTRCWQGQIDQVKIKKALDQLENVSKEGNRVICPVESAEDWEEVYQITKDSFYEAERRILLEACGYGPTSESKITSVGSIPLTCLILSKEGQPQAFSVIRPFPFPSSEVTERSFEGESELKINMLVASSSTLAKQASLTLLKGLSPGTKIKIEIQLENDGEDEEGWQKNQGETQVKDSLRFMLNKWSWENKDANKIMIYKCKESKDAEKIPEKRWEKEGLRQFCPFDAL